MQKSVSTNEKSPMAYRPQNTLFESAPSKHMHEYACRQAYDYGPSNFRAKSCGSSP